MKLRLIIILILVTFTSVHCSSQESKNSYFKNYNEAKKSGLMEKGWIPSFIPNSSYEIYEYHNLDTNIVNMTFKYKIGDTQSLKKNCTQIQIANDVLEFECLYFDNQVKIQLRSDGSGILQSRPVRNF